MNPIRTWTILSTLLVVSAFCGSIANSRATDSLTTYGQIAMRESAESIRPGVPGSVPFWNSHSLRFIYAPAFDFKPVDKATRYHFDIRSEKDDTSYTFDKDVPWASLSPVWTNIPVGFFKITVTAESDNGTTLGKAGSGRYYRAAPFNGSYHQPPPMSYDDSAQLALRNLLYKDYVNYWLAHQKPDPSYKLYRYPAKIYSALVIGAITQTRLTSGTEEARRSERLACTIADFMLTLRFPASDVWSGQVPTYYADMMPAKPQKPHMIPENHLTTMGVDAGNAFLDLYDLTGDKKYFSAARNIAETYKKTQSTEGSWPLFVNHATGKPIASNTAIPTAMINYFDRLKRDYKVAGFEETTSRALTWVMANPVKTFDWQGQFEDVKPRDSYVNQSREQACELAIYLFKNKTNLALAEDLVRFAEDQFVIWEQPIPRGDKNKNPGYNSTNWMTPSVEEQYVFWEPVGRSAGIMINTFWEAYAATGKQLYLAKAQSLANSFPNVQQAWGGDYPTFFTKYKRNFWLNSVVYPAKVLMELERNIPR